MNAHHSVGYCLRCDLYIATDLIEHCDECGERYCAECRVDTCDPNLYACSQVCAARFNFRTKYNQARKEANRGTAAYL